MKNADSIESGKIEDPLKNISPSMKSFTNGPSELLTDASISKSLVKSLIEGETSPRTSSSSSLKGFTLETAKISTHSPPRPTIKSMHFNVKDLDHEEIRVASRFVYLFKLKPELSY